MLSDKHDHVVVLKVFYKGKQIFILLSRDLLHNFSLLKSFDSLTIVKLVKLDF